MNYEIELNKLKERKYDLKFITHILTLRLDYIKKQKSKLKIKHDKRKLVSELFELVKEKETL
jgi:hypothetical protein